MRQLFLIMAVFMGIFSTGLAQIQSGYGILFLDHVEPAFESRMLEVAKDGFPSLDFTNSKDGSKINVQYEWVEISRFPLPKPDAFELFAVGLEPRDRDRIVASKRTLFLNFTYAKNSTLPAIHTISRFIGTITKDLKAAVWDDENRQILSGAEWTKRRVESWIGEQADVTKHITMHEYRDPDLERIVTLGLRKFGLPDLVLEAISGDYSRPAGNTINYCAQVLLEQGVPKNHQLVLDLRKIRHSAVREKALEYPLKGATGIVKLSFTETVREPGDADNQLFKIEFPEASGVDASEKTAQAMTELYGSENDVLYARRDDEQLLVARDQARKAFLNLKDLFKAGLKPNERLAVKYGFTDGKDTECKWIEIYAWEGDELSGVISNDSLIIAGMKAGKKVKIPASEIYDYLHYFPDGSEEGNGTGKILEGREKK
ncbi:MAG: DUF2314 domain-containing protein [Lacunisphaera sp.]